MQTLFSSATSGVRPLPDAALVHIADYVMSEFSADASVLDTAMDCLMDAMACLFLAARHSACTRLTGPVVPGITVQPGVPIPGTQHILDPVQAAFSIGTLIRWLDFNDTWLAAEWGHPSDNLGAILSVACHANLTLGDVLAAMVKAYEIQGILALENSLNHVGLDHVAFVKTASAAVIMPLLGGAHADVVNVLTQVWADGQPLRVYRHAPNTGSRKSWAAGDATRRAVQLALLVRSGEMAYPSVLTATQWGFYDVSFGGKSFSFPQSFGTYVMENILFKIAWPAEFHGQTAVECAIQLHPLVRHRLHDIERIDISTHESALRIINKKGPLYNPADRDHCLQYMVAVALLTGHLTAENYEDDFANDPRIDGLREKMHVTEEETFSRDYLDPDKRSIANAIQVFFRDGTASERIVIEYPPGHRQRRAEGRPFLQKKFVEASQQLFNPEQAVQIQAFFQNRHTLSVLPVRQFLKTLQPC